MKNILRVCTALMAATAFGLLNISSFFATAQSSTHYIDDAVNRDSEIGEEWVPLFNGKSFEGWHKLPGGQWDIEDGMIIGTSSEEEKRHGLLVTNKVFKDFTVRLKYKIKEGDSGFYFRAEEADEDVGVHGFQVEIDTNSEVGGLYETAGRRWVIKPSPEEVKKWHQPGKWNTVQVAAHGRHIVVHVNGYKTAELKNDPGRLEGHFALQLHGNMDMHVMFKDIEVLKE